MSTNIEHFDLSGRKAMVVGVENPAGAAIARAYAEAGADVALCVLQAPRHVHRSARPSEWRLAAVRRPQR